MALMVFSSDKFYLAFSEKEYNMLPISQGVRHSCFLLIIAVTRETIRQAFSQRKTDLVCPRQFPYKPYDLSHFLI